jgi:hypothetical protein
VYKVDIVDVAEELLSKESPLIESSSDSFALLTFLENIVDQEKLLCLHINSIPMMESIPIPTDNPIIKGRSLPEEGVFKDSGFC